MSTRVFDFLCPNGHRVELFVDAGTEEAKCDCGAVSVRQIATPRAVLDGCSGHFPTAADKWVARRESKMKQERKNKERHGTYD